MWLMSASLCTGHQILGALTCLKSLSDHAFLACYRRPGERTRLSLVQNTTRTAGKQPHRLIDTGKRSAMAIRQAGGIAQTIGSFLLR